MRIVQSFWSCNRNLLDSRFGWVSPQYHLMAWALSSLKLKEHYDDLHLYTDTNGYRVLIECLNLPYKTVEICYDDISYNKNLWGATKIMTYGAHNKPFIHVDGDVFIWDKFSEEIENAQLIAQNIEIGTKYSSIMISELRENLGYIPSVLDEEIRKESISSYNAGILGGSDIGFFKRYSEEALNMVKSNQLITTDDRLLLNFNILFEQILFAVLSVNENKKVTCYFNEPLEDKGYTTPMFSDFSRIALGQKYFHLIGGSKRNKSICELMSNILLKDYPEYYIKIINLFREKHIYFDSKISLVSPQLNKKRKELGSVNVNNFQFPRTKHAISIHEREEIVPNDKIDSIVKQSKSEVIREVFNYEVNLSSFFNKWLTLSAHSLHSIECSVCHYFDFFTLSKADQLNVILRRNPFLEMVEDSFDWLPTTKTLINTDIGLAPFEEINGIACIPRLFLKGYEEILIDELDYNIMLLLETPLTLKSLLNELEPCFTQDEIKDNYALVYEPILRKLKHLFHSKCIFLEGSFTLSN